MDFFAPLGPEQVPALDAVLALQQDRQGYTSHLSLALARNPVLVAALEPVMQRGLFAGTLGPADRQILLAVASAASGCLYTFCQAGYALQEAGLPGTPLVQALRELDTTTWLDERVRVAAVFARDMSSIPNGVGPSHFEDLRRFYSDAEIVEIAFVVCLQGLLHRLSGMLGSVPEPPPLAWASAHLGPRLELPDLRRAPGSPSRPAQAGVRLAPLSADQVPELAQEFSRFADSYVPNSFLVMARRPDLVKAMIGLWSGLLSSRTVPSDLAYMASWISSYATGCLYCQAHTSLHANNSGVPAEKIANLWTFADNPLFSETERAAMHLAVASASQPSAMSAELAEQLRRHFDDRTIIDLMASIASFGFYNRWNDTFVTPLEDQPFEFASDHLSTSGWAGGRHRPGALTP